MFTYKYNSLMEEKEYGKVIVKLWINAESAEINFPKLQG